MKFPSVGILLVNYNGSKDTIECINSLKNNKYQNYKIIIVDNNSSYSDYKEIEKYIKENNLDIELIRLEKNLGFAGGNNIGIKYAIEELNCDYVLLINNDTLVDESFLNELVNKSESSTEIGIATSKIFYYPERNKIWYAGGKIDWFKFTSIHFGEKEYDDEKYNKDAEVDFISGCVMLIKKSVIEEVGYLPEEYFMYYEDFDYCIKVRDKGFKLAYVSKSKVYHKISASTGGEESAFSLEYGSRNRKLLLKKYKDRIGFNRYILSIFYYYVTRIIKLIKFYFKGEKDKCNAIISGMK